MPDLTYKRLLKLSRWTNPVKASADPERVKHFLGLLASTPAGGWLERASADQIRILVALLAGSRALSDRLILHPELVEVFEPDALKFPRRKQGIRQQLDQSFAPLLSQQAFGSALARVRQFKEREMLRIATRDLAGLGSLPEIIQEISDVADICLSSVWEVCYAQQAQRSGVPYHKDLEGRWQRTAGGVLGLGKLGGQELNYSSDVDVVFVYSEEGEIHKEPPPKTAARTQKRAGGSGAPERGSLTNHQFFNRLAEVFVAELTRVTPEGTLYRIDLRLRPEGEIGPLSRSLASYENYYAQWGQTWERMMLIKARGVAGDATLASEFLEMIQPFRYPRSINESALREVGAMKDRIETEVVKAGELERNVKLGRGGIREIEFVVQSLQLLHAGRQPFLQGPQTLPVLEKLVQYDLVAPEVARSLHEAYLFLRNVEHRLQMEDNRQTHSIPLDLPAQERLARLMNFADHRSFETARRKHAGKVREIFESVLKKEIPTPQTGAPFPLEFAGAEAEWKQILAAHAFRNADTACRVLREFVEGPGYVHVSPRTKELAHQLLPKLFALCPQTEVRSPKGEGRGARPALASRDPEALDLALRPPPFALPAGRPPLSDPDRVITRLDSFISAYGARATLFELWHSNPAIFELLVLLFDRSEFLAELAIRTPDLVDELVGSGRLRVRKSAQETLADLRHGLDDPDQHLWLRRYHQAELMRIGLRDILGLADFEQYLVELSALADACLQYALEVAMRRNRIRKLPFVIIGLGKLGGREIDYGSDLDIIFVADSGAQGLTKLSRLALEVMDLLTRRTEQGVVFHTDARLRPDGEKGLLVNTLEAYEQYYRRRAQLWEIQTLTRTRPIAGDMALGAEFQELAATLSNFRKPQASLAAYAPDWKAQIQQMRLRIEKGRTPAGKDELAIKTGKGGLMDAEFIAQTLAMANGWQEPNTLRALERGVETGLLPEGPKLIENYRRLRRVEGVLRRWSYEGETVLPDDPAPFYRVSIRCGFPTSEAFREAIGRWRGAIREVYLQVFKRTGKAD